MSQLASDFVTASTSDIDTTIHRALEIVTRFAKVERGYVFLLTEDGQTLILTHEWCMPGVLAHKGVLESLAVADFSEFVDSLKRGEVANVQTAEVPRTPDTKAMTDILDLLEIRSFVNIPMHVTNGFVGFIGFDATYTPTIWSEETIAEFRFTGQMIASTLERRRVEREIRLANSLLEQRVAERTLALEVANKELEAFSYSVSHDLRTPLRAIDGYSQALLEDCSSQLDSTGKNYLQRTRAATQRMGSLIDDMLKLARVTRNPLKKELVDLSSMVQTIAADLQEQQPARKAHWKIEPNLIAQADPALLKMALDNLIGNAWKFTSKIEETCIEFGQTPMHGDKTYYVRDNGAGFDMAYADQLFQPFYRLHGQTEFEGSGIGLATVQRVMTRHGGRVWVEAAVHKGATFYFTL
ncbi:MAG: histidine kinase [Anaerolineae bacterium]|nr:histidine kinase [Anaerolineae bacterium]